LVRERFISSCWKRNKNISTKKVWENNINSHTFCLSLLK
jgi:hypothetical protein